MRRLGLAAAMAAVLLIGLIPATASAAPVMTFGEDYGGLTLRSHCISGNGPANAPVHVVWKSAGGTVKAIVDVESPWGHWYYCSALRRLAVGDTIRATSGRYARTFTMPNITLNANRVSATFSGIGLQSATGQLWFHAGIFADYDEGVLVTADSKGRWKYSDGAWGGIWASVMWTTAKGDFLTAEMIVPYVNVTIGRAKVEGGGRPVTDFKINLRDASNVLRGQSTAKVGDEGFLSGTFRDSTGHAVAVRVGDRIVSNIASDLDWHVPQITGSADVANDFVYGECGSTEIESYFAVVHVYRRGVERGYAHAFLDDNHQLAVDFWEESDMFFDPANIKHGDRIVIDCYYETGDIVSFPFRVP